MSRYILLIAFCATFWAWVGCGQTMPTPTPGEPTSTKSASPVPPGPGGVSLPLCPHQENLVSAVYNHEPINGLLYIVIDNTESVQTATQGKCGGASPEEDRRFAPEYVLSLLSTLPQTEQNKLSVRFALIGASKGQDSGFYEILGPTEVSALKMRNEWRVWLRNPSPLESDGGTNYHGIFQKIAEDIQAQPNIKPEKVTIWVLTDGIGISNKTQADETQKILIDLSKRKKVQIEISILCAGALTPQEKDDWGKIAGVGNVSVNDSGNKIQWIKNILAKESIRPFLPEKHAWVWPGLSDSHSYHGLSSLSLYQLHWYMLEDDSSDRFQITWEPAFFRNSTGKIGYIEINFLETSPSCSAPALQIKPDTSTSIGFTWLEEIRPQIEMSVNLPTNAVSINLKPLGFSPYLDFSKSGWTKADIQSKAVCLSLCSYVPRSGPNPNANQELLFFSPNDESRVFSTNGFGFSANLELRPKANPGQSQSTCFDLGLTNGEDVIALQTNNCVALQYKPSLNTYSNILDKVNSGEVYTIKESQQTISSNIMEFSLSVRYAPEHNYLAGTISSTLDDTEVTKRSIAIKPWKLSPGMDTPGCPDNHRLLRWDPNYPDPKIGDYFVCKQETLSVIVK